MHWVVVWCLEQKMVSMLLWEQLSLWVHWLGPGLPSDHQLEQGSEMEEVLL